MIGDTVSIRFSRRIKEKASLLPAGASPKKKIRKSAVKKRASGVNSSFLKAKEKTKVGGKNKLGESPKQALKILKRASRNLKPVVCKSPRISIPKICDKNRKTRNFLKTSQINLTINKVSSKNLELFDNSKKVIGRKNRKKFVNEEKLTVRRSLRLSKSSPSPKEKGKNKELSDSDLKPSKKRRPSQKKSTKKVNTLSSESVLTTDPEKCNMSKLSGRKKSTRLSTEPRNQEISVQMPASKSLPVIPVPGKVTRISRHSGNRKSGRLSKEPNRLRMMNSEISLYTSSFHSLLETPQPKKHSEKRKSSRLLEPSPLRTLNKELPLSTPASLHTRNPDSTLNKSSKSCKSVELLSPESHSRKQSRLKVSNKYGSTVSYEKRKQKRQINRKTSENFKKPLSNETENLPLDILTTPAFNPSRGRSLSKKYLSKSDSKSSKRKLNASASENQIASEELQDAKKRKSAGDNVCVDNSTSPLKCRSMKKSICPVKISHTKKLINNRNFEVYLPPVMNIQGKVDVLTADLFEKKSCGRAGFVPFENEIDCFSTFGEGKGKYIDLSKKQSQKKVKFRPCGNEINCLSPVDERKGKSTSNLKRKPVKRLIPHVISPNVNSALSSNTSTEKTIEKKALPVKSYSTKKYNSYETLQVSSPPIKVDCLTADLYEVKHKRAKSVPSKNNDGGLLCERGTSAFSEKRWIKTLAPVKFTRNVNVNTESSLPNSKLGTLFQLPIDDLTTNESASCSQNVDRLVVNVLSPCCISKKKTHSWPLGNELSSEISAKDDFPKIPAKGTLKHKRWLLNNLKEKNGSYEDDIFENQNFDLYKPAFHFGDESDGSSVNIATPKFDCILTPALPKKTPHFKDCISPTEFLQARKTAEEYMYRRNKKRKSGDRPSSSGKKTSVNKKNTVQEIPEKKKLDFEEAVTKLIAVQKNLEIEAEVDDEEEDCYFSDASN
ncbi:hypothetical protein AVEN_46094-1 [Araneus ventricosus]|uniref:Uncharacterized protein n=1 Tax=Araneus ventricosus TaxID=182803 RepID=A0A4Y2HIT2_ARAVE|nr:hypothetical protein AVEN_46094-1 [Araneus ventricosus]